MTPETMEASGRDDSADDSFTTVMLRNIPNRFNRQRLVKRLHDAGFKGDIDYMYLPMDFVNRCNVGYCFVNFRSVAARQRFSEVFDGVAAQSCLPPYNSQKVCQVIRAKLQGREENIRRSLGSPELVAMLAQHPEWLPIKLTEQGKEEMLSYEPPPSCVPGWKSGYPPRPQSREGDSQQQLPACPAPGPGELTDGFPGGRAGGGEPGELIDELPGDRAGGGEGAGGQQRRGSGRGRSPQVPGLAAYPGPAGHADDARDADGAGPPVHADGGWGDMSMLPSTLAPPVQGLQYMGPPWYGYENDYFSDWWGQGGGYMPPYDGYFSAHQPMGQGGHFYDRPYMQPCGRGYLSGWWDQGGSGRRGTPEEM